MRVCAEPGCPTLTKRTRCAKHQQAADQARGTRQQRGYDAAHDRARRAILARIQAGEIIRCWRCRCALDETFHLDHTDGRTDYRGPACMQCNLQLAGQKRHGISPHAYE